MRINPNYKIREIAGENIVVNHGTVNVNTTRIISLNKSTRLLYETLAEQDFTIGIDKTQAQKDAEKRIESLKQCGIID